MDREELVRMAGEQSLLAKERREAAAELERHRRAIVGLANSIDRAADPQWLEDATTMLREVHRVKRQLMEMDARLADLAKLTGL